MTPKRGKEAHNPPDTPRVPPATPELPSVEAPWRPQREARRAEVDAFVSHWTSGMTRDEILSACEAGQVPCGPVYGIDEIFADPQYAARENLVRVDDERAGELVLPAVCPRLSETPGSIRWAGRALGADSAAILADWLD